jgi:DNA-binding beta-propeller fold protein YncE
MNQLSLVCAVMVFASQLQGASTSRPPQIQNHVKYLFDLSRRERGEPLVHPLRVFVNHGRNEIYVIDGSSASLRLFDGNGLFIQDFHLGRGGAAQDVVVDRDGYIYVLAGGIGVFDFRGKFDRNIDLPFVPSVLEIDGDDNLLLADAKALKVRVYDRYGKVMLEFGAEGEQDGEFKSISDIYAYDHKLYVLDNILGRVTVFDSDGAFLHKFGEKGGIYGKLSSPVALAVDKQGRVYVLDTMRHTIQVADEEGECLYEFGGLGGGRGWFHYPADIDVDDAGRIIVADRNNNCVQVMQSKRDENDDE